MAEAIGTSHTTILRALRGELIDLDTIIKIADFLDVRASTLLDGFGKKDTLVVRVATVVEHVPGLAKILEEASAAVDAGAADDGLIEDIVSYAAYKLNASGGHHEKQHGRLSKAGRPTDK
jgi:transcriptional regulator with XRE-family HTH domain